MREEVSNKVFIGLHASLATLEKKGKSAWLGFLFHSHENRDI